MSQSVADPLAEYAKTQGDKLAVIEDRPDGTLIEWSYADLEYNATRLARVLINLGVVQGTKIIWCGRNSHWVVATMQACRKVGAVSVPLNYRLSAEETAYVVDNSDAKFVIADAEYVDLFASVRKDIPNVRDILIFGGTPAPDMWDMETLVAAAEADVVATLEAPGGSMIYTSGTTGKPKGAVRENVGDPEQIAALMGMIGYRPDDVYLTTGPLYHSGPSSFMSIGLMMGQSVVLQRKFNEEDWLRLVDKYKVSSTFSAPTPIRRVVQLDDTMFEKYDTSTMRILIANAAPWSYALKKEYLERFPEKSLFEIYGSTELGVNTVLTPEYQLSKPGSCGRPSPGVEIVLIDEDGDEVTEPNKPGEVFIRSASIFTTYHKAQEKFDADRRGDFQTVGDIAYRDEEGFYFICDRKNDMIISGGMNIYPAEIEDALYHHPDILDVAVFGIPSEEWGESVHAAVVARPDSGLSEDGIGAFSRERLASYKIPRSVDFCDDIPRNGSGKILKKELRKPYWKEHESGVL